MRTPLLILSTWCLVVLKVQSAEFKPTAQDSIASKGAKMEMVWAEGEFTEGPVLGPGNVIHFSDIGNRTMCFNPATGKTTVHRAASGKVQWSDDGSQGQPYRLRGCQWG